MGYFQILYNNTKYVIIPLVFIGLVAGIAFFDLWLSAVYGELLGLVYTASSAILLWFCIMTIKSFFEHRKLRDK